MVYNKMERETRKKIDFTMAVVRTLVAIGALIAVFGHMWCGVGA